VAIANAISVRNRNSLTKSEQPMRSFAIQTGSDGTKLEWLASRRLNRISKNTGDDLLGMVKQHRERVGNRRARYQQLTVTGRKQL
jgi:hypothetical protein